MMWVKLFVMCMASRRFHVLIYVWLVMLLCVKKDITVRLDQSLRHNCGSSAYYCPRGSSIRTTVSVGYYTTPIGPTRATNRSSQLECPRGSYCIGGIRTLCPAGTYGATTGLFTSACSGPCTPGHYCEIGAWDRQEQ